jgi:hypothetical protein
VETAVLNNTTYKNASELAQLSDDNTLVFVFQKREAKEGEEESEEIGALLLTDMEVTINHHTKRKADEFEQSNLHHSTLQLVQQYVNEVQDLDAAKMQSVKYKDASLKVRVLFREEDRVVSVSTEWIGVNET